MSKKVPEKKKLFVLLPAVKDFLRDQPGDVKQELNSIIHRLETQGQLVMPFAEKVTGEDLFAIRVVQAGNIRIFYIYGIGQYVFGLHGYAKKTQQIPVKELRQAKIAAALLREEGMVK